MAKQIFACPSCNNSSTYQIESQISRFKENVSKNFFHFIIRCDVCEEITYKIFEYEKTYKGNYVPPEIKNEEKFQYPFGYLLQEDDLPESIKSYYFEAYECFKIGALKASAAMCRATISAICDDKKVVGDDLGSRIQNLPLSARLKGVAKNIKWIGDKTLHNGINWTEAKWTINTAEEVLSFISRIIDDLYTQERKAKELNKLVSKAASKVK